MPIARIGYGTDFILKNQGVGVATDTTDVKLEVGGTTKANYNISGIASLANYAGFAAAEQSIDGTLTLTGEHSTLGDIVVGIGSTFIVSSGSTVEVGTVPSVSIGTHFSPPTGGVEERPEVPVEGTVRFNKDLNTLEFYNGVDWRQFTVSGRSGRGILAGGYKGPANDESNIGVINIASAGNAQNFGELATGRSCRAASSETRGLLACGFVSPTGSNIIEYITMASTGNSIDFGDSTHQRRNHAFLSSSTRAVLAGGESPADLNVMDYVQIGTLGNALDFGDLTANRKGQTGMSSPVRGIYTADQNDYNTSSAEFITIASKGNANDFGELDDSRANAGSTSNGVRGLIAGGYNGGSRISLVSSCIMSSTGNFTSFGNLTKASDRGDGMSNSTRAVYNGGYPSNDNGMDSIEFASGGSGTSFGFDNVSRGQNGGFCSDSHGGLGGY